MILIWNIFLILYSCQMQEQEPSRPKGFHQQTEIPCMHCHVIEMPKLHHNPANNCSQCHLSYDQWPEALFAHDPMPDNCDHCHETSRPENRLVSGSLGLRLPGHYDGQNCVECHQSNNEIPWTFNHLSAIGNQTSNCRQCHISSQPRLNHAPASQCANCHQPTQWHEGLFAHSPLPEDCGNCHFANRPDKKFVPQPVSQSTAGHYEGQDCGECHQYSAESDFTFDHYQANKEELNSCLPCHYERAMAVTKPDHSRFRPSRFNNCQRCHEVHYSWEIL